MISSISNPKVKELLKLHQSKYRRQEQKFLVENFHLVSEAMNTNHLLELYVTQENLLTFTPQYRIDEKVAKKLSQTQSSPQMIGIVRKPQGKTLIGNILVLEDLQDPGNVGTLLRSALSFGYQTVVFTKNTVDYTNDKVVRASQGALFHLNLIEMERSSFIQQARLEGYTLLASVVTDGQPVNQIKTTPHALLLGNEGSGLSKESIDQSDLKVTVPTQAFESLNVAIAGSIMMYELSESK